MADDKRQANENAQEQGQASNGHQFSVQRIFVKDLSFEAPLGVNAFSQPWKPQVNQELNSKNQKIGDDQYEVVLSLTVTVKLEDKVAFLIEVQQGGLFTIRGLEDRQLAQVLNTMCLQILFPYARETVDSLASKGSFPTLMLPPINFEALFAQAVAQSQAKAQAENGEQEESKTQGDDQIVN